MKVSLSYISIHNLDDDVVDVIVAVLTDVEYQPLGLHRLELGGDLEHARARVDRGVLVVPCAVINDAGLVGGGAAARAVAVADGAAVGLDEEIERAVAVAAVLCSRFSEVERLNEDAKKAAALTPMISMVPAGKVCEKTGPGP